jgi:acrylyl-CoA reductase (NADPH)
MSDTFPALVAQHNEPHTAGYTELSLADLDAGDVEIAVEYSTLNYKDGLAMTGASPIVQRYPLVLGIDYAGTVLASDHPGFAPGDRVVRNGFGASENCHGGYASRAHSAAEHLVKLPDSLTTAQAMAIGTAGYTAMLCVLELEDGGVQPDQGEVLVTGAAGGVGSIAVSLLSSLGYSVVAATGRSEEADYLMALGAADVVPRDSLSQPGKPMQRERWAGVVDCVGSHTLGNAIAQTRYGGVVTACGLAQGADLPATVLPFILRGVRLQGVDSVQAPLARREQAWTRLGSDLDREALARMSFELPFEELLERAPQILAGAIRGRAVVRLPQA